MVIPLWVDPVKDERLIEWLNGKTNRSAAIREILYMHMTGSIGNKGIEPSTNNEVPVVDNDFINGFKAK